MLEAFRRECVCGEGEARQILAKYYFCGAAVMKRVSSLSGGEKVLLKLAVLLQNRVNFLILDEPTNHIDIETREMLEDALLEFSGTLLFISHDRYFIDKLATKIVVLENRKSRFRRHLCGLSARDGSRISEPKCNEITKALRLALF